MAIVPRKRKMANVFCAAAKSKRIGRPQTTIDDILANVKCHYPAYKNGGNLTSLARLCNISRTTAYKWLGLVEG